MRFNIIIRRSRSCLFEILAALALLLLPAVQAGPAIISDQFNVNTTLGPAPLTIIFTSQTVDSYGNTMTNWAWDFGDGATATNQNPSHTYTNDGVYIPTLLGIDNSGSNVVGIGPSITIGQLPNLVVNGDFETGTFAGWSLAGDTFDMSVSSNATYAHAGTFGAQLGPKTGTLTQVLSTGPGTNYLLSFWLDSPDGLTPNQFTAKWNGSNVVSLTNIAAVGWSNFTFAVTATQSNTVLEFDVQNVPSYFGFDEVNAGLPVVTPASQTAECGSTVTLNVASNTATVSGYQWYSGTPPTNAIATATNSSLVLTNVSSNPATTPTNYVVVINNGSGSFTSAVVSLAVVDTTLPIIIMNGANVVILPINSPFVDPGATATACAGPVTLTTNGFVNPNVLGVYTITYTAVNGANVAVATRTVQVVPRTYNNLVLGTPNLLGYWPFTFASGPNSVVNGVTGSYSNGASLGFGGSGPTNYGTFNNTSVLLNGSGAYVDTSLVDGLTNNAGSIIGWFYLTSLPSTAGHPFVIAGESQPTNDFTLEIATNNEIECLSSTNAAVFTADTNALTGADLNGWHFVAATFSSGVSCDIYLDGALVASNANPGVHSAASGSTFAMGASDTVAGEYFTGRLADVAIFDSQLASSDISTLYAAATAPVSVVIASPTNGNAFTTNQNITFTVNATAVNGLQTLVLYTNGVPILTTNVYSVSLTLSNLPPGSYPLSASVTDDTGVTVTSSIVHVTVNVPGTSLLDFDLPDASAGPVGGAGLSNYLATFGVSLSNVTAGATVAIQEAQNVGNGNVVVAFSQPNVLTETGSNGLISYTLAFNHLYNSITWERAALLASGGGVAAPGWTAYALDTNGNEITQTGESRFSSSTAIPAKLFKVTGSNIAAITFTGNNRLSPLRNIALDSLVLSSNAIGPVPQISLSSSNVSTGEPGQITLNASAFEVGGTISSINFFENQNPIGIPTTVIASTNSTSSVTVDSLAPGSYSFYATATDTNGQVAASGTISLTVTPVAGVSVINFDDPVLLNTSLGAVGGTNISNYLGGFGVSISNVSLGTTLEAINQNSFSGNELPLPSSLPNLFTQVGSSQPVTFGLYFATNQQSISFTRTALLTNGPSGISHPAWTARALDASGNELESVSEPLLFSTNDIPARTFTLYGNNIASIRFDSDSQQSAAFAAVLLDDLVLNANAAANPLSITLASPGGPFTAPASINLSPSASDGTSTITQVNFYSGPTLIGTSTNGPSFAFTWTNVLNGNFNLTAKMFDAAGYALLSPVVTASVNPGALGVPLVVNFDALNTSNGPVTGTNLGNYLATNGGLSIETNLAGTVVGVENESDAGGGGFVSLSSLPNLLTQLGSNGPASFVVAFSNLLTQFSFTRPDLVPNPSVTHPAWTATAFDPLGNALGSVSEGRITSLTNVPAASYTLGGGSIATVQFNSFGTGFETFNAALLDDFVVTAGNASNLPPAVAITNPIPGQLFVSNAVVTIGAATAAGAGTVTGVGFYYNGTNLAGSAQASPFTISWNAPSNAPFVLTAIVTNSAGLASTSAPVSITVGAGFAITSEPASAAIPLGGTNVFAVTTSGTNVTYQWQTNGMNIPGATLASYTVSDATLSATGGYTVIATSFGLSITSQPPAILTVVPPPTINSLLQSPSNVNIGDTVTLTVNATDTIPFYYQWQLNGTPIGGATNSTFVISNAQPLNSGAYRVVVANAVAVTNSPIFGVQVNLGTLIATTNNYTFAGAKAIAPLIGPIAQVNSNSPSTPGPTEPTSVIAGKPAGRFLWFNWTANFTGVVSLTTLGSSFDTLMAVYTGNTATNLTLIGQDDDSGGFFTSLIAFNCVQGVTYHIGVAGYKGAAGTVVLGLPGGTGYRVLDPTSGAAVPLITAQPSNQVVNVGDPVTLSVTASNANSYQWFFAGAPVVGIGATTHASTNSAFSTNVLVISNFPAGAVGNYYALAANSVGAAQSAVAAVEIALSTNSTSTNTPSTLTVDKFGDAVDLTSAGSAARYRPEDAGGDTGNFVLSQSFSTVGATKEAGEPNHAGQPGGASYWYSYTAPGSGTLQFDTRGSTFNTILAVYTGPGTSFATLVNVGAAYTSNYVAQGQPVVVVSNVIVGTKYFIAIDGYLGASGAAHLNVVLNLSTNSVNTNIPPVTNNYASFAMSYPPNKYLTTSSNLTIRGTVRGVSGAHPPLVSYVGASINNGTVGHADLTATNFASVLEPGPGGVEEAVPEETVTWSSNVTLVLGANVITVQRFSIQGNGTVDTSPAITRTIFLVPTLPVPPVKSTVTLATNGHGRITGVANNANLELNKVYTATAVPVGNWIFSNWTLGTNLASLSAPPNGNNAALSFAMSSNLILQANFVTNPFTALAGVYNGLFAPVTGVTEESSGFITATIPASSRGAYTAKIMVDGGAFPFTAAFDLNGNSGKTINRGGGKTSLTVELQMNLASSGDQITGAILDDESNGWVSQVLADRAVFNAKSNPATNYNGRFTLIFPPGPTAPTNDPSGYGVATLTNSVAGQIALTGHLGDGTAISQTVPVARDGSIPLYTSLYANNGSLLGWLNVANGSSNITDRTIQGINLAWMKSATKGKALYAAGFTNTSLTAFGTFYGAPASGSSAITLTNGTLILSNGNLSGALVYSNLTIANNKLVNNNPSNPPNPLSGVINPATGMMTITFKATGANHSTTASGVVLQNGGMTDGAGWFLGTNQSGFFLLQQ